MSNLKRPNTFLIEIIICLFFFAISASVALQFFAGAHTRQTLSYQKISASIEAQSVLEQFRVKGEALFTEALSGAVVQNDGEKIQVRLFYDDEWKISSVPSSYLLDLDMQKDDRDAGTLYTIKAAVYRQNDETVLFETLSAKYFPIFEK